MYKLNLNFSLKKRLITILGMLLLSSALVFGCSDKEDTQEAEMNEQTEEADQDVDEADPEEDSDTQAEVVLEDGTYTAEFSTDM